jgi:hypothetical protein
MAIALPWNAPVALEGVAPKRFDRAHEHAAPADLVLVDVFHQCRELGVSDRPSRLHRNAGTGTLGLQQFVERVQQGRAGRVRGG